MKQFWFSVAFLLSSTPHDSDFKTQESPSYTPVSLILRIQDESPLYSTTPSQCQLGWPEDMSHTQWIYTVARLICEILREINYNYIKVNKVRTLATRHAMRRWAFYFCSGSTLFYSGPDRTFHFDTETLWLWTLHFVVFKGTVSRHRSCSCWYDLKIQA